MLDDLGLRVASSHAWADPADLDTVAAAADAFAELGSPRMILTPRPPIDSAAAVGVCDQLVAAAEVASRSGVRLGYHNHDTELRSVDGVQVIDRMATRVGDAIDFQVDIFWVVVGGADPARSSGGWASGSCRST